VATECRSTFFNISLATIVNKWLGESEKMMRVLFDLVKHYSPSTKVLDEIVSIMSSRESADSHEAMRRLKTELLIQHDELVKNYE